MKKKMQFTSLVACTALALFGAAGHAHATASNFVRLAPKPLPLPFRLRISKG